MTFTLNDGQQNNNDEEEERYVEDHSVQLVFVPSGILYLVPIPPPARTPTYMWNR